MEATNLLPPKSVSESDSYQNKFFCSLMYHVWSILEDIKGLTDLMECEFCPGSGTKFSPVRVAEKPS